MPVPRAILAHSRAGNGLGFNCLASGAYSETGMPSFSMTHSCRPSTLYKPQWMNMPKRASCHHFMRRARSASCEGEVALGCGPGIGASVCSKALEAMGAAAVAASTDAVLFSHVRRVILLSGILISVAFVLRSQQETYH